MIKNLIEKFNIFIKTKIDGNQNYINENLNTNFTDNDDKDEKHKKLGDFYAYQILENLEKHYNETSKLDIIMNNVKDLIEANIAYNNYHTISIFLNNEIFKKEEFKKIYNDVTCVFSKALSKYKCDDLLNYLNENSLTFYLKFVNEKYKNNNNEYKNSYIDLYLSQTYSNYLKRNLDNNIIYLLNNESTQMTNSYMFFELYGLNNEEIKNKLNQIIDKEPKQIMELFFDKYKDANKTSLAKDIISSFQINDEKRIFTLIDSIKEQIDCNKLIEKIEDDQLCLTKDSSNYIKNKKLLNLFEQNDFVNNQEISINDIK